MVETDRSKFSPPVDTKPPIPAERFSLRFLKRKPAFILKLTDICSPFSQTWPKAGTKRSARPVFQPSDGHGRSIRRLVGTEERAGLCGLAAMPTQGPRPLVEVVRLGLLPYGEALRVQEAYVRRCRAGAGASHALLLCQHPPVYTTGIRQKGRPPAELERLRLLGAQVHNADRGGLITFHGPGQLLCYPVLHLAAFKKSVRWYVSQLERTAISACAGLGVEASATPHTGVWVGDNKICAIGIRCSRYVTSHGLALNCDTDLAWFRHIVPCGLEGKGATSLSAERGRRVAVDEAVPHVLRAFARHFRCRLLGDGLSEARA